MKTYVDLAIPEIMYNALVEVLRRLEMGKLSHARYIERNGVETSELMIGNFNMRTWGDTNSCGTVACIGGWVELIGGFKFGDGNGARTTIDLYELFFPPSMCNYNDITTQQAARATRNYLEDGNAKWDEVLI